MRALVFGGATGYVDLGSRVMDGSAGVTLVLTVRLDASGPPIPKFARIFDAGSGCADATAMQPFACESTMHVGTGGSTGTEVLAGATARSGGYGTTSADASVASVLPFWPPGEWAHVVMTFDGGGTLRLYSAGKLAWTTSAQGGLPAAMYSGGVYMGRGQDPTDPTRFRGAISDLQLYFTVLGPTTVTHMAAGDDSACPGAAPPPPGSRRRSRDV